MRCGMRRVRRACGNRCTRFEQIQRGENTVFTLAVCFLFVSFADTKVTEYHVQHVLGADRAGDLTDAAQRQPQLMRPDGQIVNGIVRLLRVVGSQEMLGEIGQMVEALGDVLAMALLADDRRLGAGRSASGGED